ncbi:HdeD family acid-resistance protein [Leptolyngbya sp. KIOST-1]|uniref:HdeD family acid-resistance protein n=1 Tax=Leptolyngbya sp. KIOST-1 TaxID=1229172 RepID=UPI0006917598|nr:HdeD family acid-resistance protein [Leptolyngbya sp. KIOST-1]
MTTNILSSEEIKKATGWVIFLSIGLIVLGILAIVSPMVASAFFTAMMGWIALISGILMVIQSFRSHPVRGFWLNLIVGLLYAISGLYILFNLAAALLALTLAFGILFIVEGVYTIIMGFVQKVGRSMSWLVVLNGVVTLILGIMVLNRWPVSALWLIGLYVGISLLLTGVSLLAAALAARKLSDDMPVTDTSVTDV